MSAESRVEWDLFIVGAGSAGLRAARCAAERGVRTAISESRELGGTCVNRGCIPKKLYAYASEYGQAAVARSYGWSGREAVRFELSALRAAKDREVARLRSLYERGSSARGVKVFRGGAQILEKGEGGFLLQVEGQRVRASRVLLASGAEPIPLEVEGGEHAFTSDDVFTLGSVPKRVAVVGGGYIALECAAIFNGVGAETMLLHRNRRVLRGFDEDCAAQALRGMEARGVKVCLDRSLRRIVPCEEGFRLDIEHRGEGEDSTFVCDFVLAAVGRRAVTRGLGLERLGIRLDARGKIPTNAGFETEVEGLYALGDVTDSPELTPVAIRQAEVFVQRVFGEDSAVWFDPRVLPKAVFCSPPLARVGLSEGEVSFPTRVYEAWFVPLRRRFFVNENMEGEDSERILLKLIERAEGGVAVGEGEVVGCHMTGADSPEIIQSLAPALSARAKKRDFDAVIPLHPTSAEEFMTLRTFRMGRGVVGFVS